jgi:hypothetical protein
MSLATCRERLAEEMAGTLAGAGRIITDASDLAVGRISNDPMGKPGRPAGRAVRAAQTGGHHRCGAPPVRQLN